MSHQVAAIGSDPVLSCGFCLIAAALLTKAAIVPFHMWLPDAHAVAPSPVSVIFSGIMVSSALLGLAKLVVQIFIHDAAVMALVHSLLLWLGAITAILGGAMAWAQRHLKRLLAFSTIAHLGIMLTGIAAITPAGMAAFTLYLFGHGLVKGSLFMIAGILLALRASADEIALYNQGRNIRPAGIAMVIAGLLLGGLPVGLLHDASDLIQSSAPAAAIAAILGTALTGAAVLRAAARVFFGLSGTPGEEITAPTQREHEKNDRPLWLMLLPCGVLLAIALIPGDWITPFLGQAGTQLFDSTSHVAGPMPEADPLLSYVPIIITFVLLLVALFRRRATGFLARRLFRFELLPFRGLQFLHSGLVGDYVVWMILGLGALAVALAG
jgi:multicomponent Na+:H+ antiporter subunit D